MKFNIKDIAQEGRPVNHRYTSAEVRAMLGKSELEPLDRPAELEVELTLYRTNDAVMVYGSARGSYWLSCSRCLGPCHVKVDEPDLRLTFLPPPTEFEQERELDLDDLDTATHDGVEVDLEPLLCEQLVLALPIKLLCQPECKGICPSCGADMNDKPCDCKEELPETNPWKRALMQLNEEK